jgi:lysophospholipase L1-like esterase
MRHSFTSTLLAVVGLSVSACAGSTSSATGGDAPLPTIGLGSDIGEGGQISGGAEVRAVGTTEIDTVIMVGDSITVASTPQLETMFEQLGFDNVIIESKVGKRTALNFGSNPSGAQVAENIVNFIHSVGEGDAQVTADDPFDHSNELWVVALGTNDIDQYSDPAERAAAINEMLQTVPDESPLIWVDTFFRDRPDGTADINDTIRDRVSQRGSSMIAPWSAVADDEGNLRTDGVHPREQGSIVFANVVGNAIIDFLRLA